MLGFKLIRVSKMDHMVSFKFTYIIMKFIIPGKLPSDMYLDLGQAFDK